MDEIRQYVEGLSDDQVRFVRILLASKRSTDIVAQAPLEIVATIAKLLDNASYASCLAVSSSWRRCLLTDTTLTSFARVAYPSLFCSSAPSRPAILDALAITSRRDNGTIRSVLHTQVCLDSPVFQDNETPRHQPSVHSSDGEDEPISDATIRYADGKIAWSFEWTFIVLDDLIQKTRRYLYTPLGPMFVPMISLLALGDRLVVAYGGGHLIAWDHVERPVTYVALISTNSHHLQSPRVLDLGGLTLIKFLC